MEDGILSYGGAISVDIVHLKVRGKHYYVFTLRYIFTRCNRQFENVKFEVKNRTLLPVEGPDSPSANINAALTHEYEISIDRFA